VGYDYSQAERIDLIPGSFPGGKGGCYLNDAGRVASTEWEKFANRFPIIDMDEFVVMPNTIHGIIVVVDHIVGTSRLDPIACPRFCLPPVSCHRLLVVGGWGVGNGYGDFVRARQDSSSLVVILYFASLQLTSSLASCIPIPVPWFQVAILNILSQVTVVFASQSYYTLYMEHIFYYPCLPAPGCLSPVFGGGDWVPGSPFMDRILFEFKNDFSIWLKWSTEKFCVFSVSLLNSSTVF
jgi:hypothetical protein